VVWYQGSLFDVLIGVLWIYLMIILIPIAIVVILAIVLLRERTGIRFSYREFVIGDMDPAEAINSIAEGLRRRGLTVYYWSDDHIVLDGPLEWHILRVDSGGAQRLSMWISPKSWVIVVGIISLVNFILTVLFGLYLYMKYDDARGTLRIVLRDVLREYAPL